MAVVLSIKNISGKEKFTLFGSIFLIGVLYITASFFAGNEAVIIGLYIAMIFLFGCCIICAAISFRTLLQKKTDNSFAGRVFAVVGSVGNASIPGAMIVYGILLEIYDFQDLLMISGLVLIPLSIISFILYKEAKHVPATEVLSKPFT
jgi:DHA3 family macrolide efflux protein-like MFS transporter